MSSNCLPVFLESLADHKVHDVGDGGGGEEPTIEDRGRSCDLDLVALLVIPGLGGQAGFCSQSLRLDLDQPGFLGHSSFFIKSSLFLYGKGLS